MGDMAGAKPKHTAVAYAGAARFFRGLRSVEHVARVTEGNGRRIAPTTIANIENENRQASVEVLEALAKAYGCEVSALGHVIAEGERVCTECRGWGYHKAPVTMEQAA